MHIPPFYPPRKWGGGSPWHSRAGENGVVEKTRRSGFDGYANSGRFWGILAKPPNEAILDLRDPQNRTRDHDSIPKGQKISSYGPFSSHFMKISSQIQPNPSQATWVEPGFGVGFFFQWTTLDFEGSKKASETSFLDS